MEMPCLAYANSRILAIYKIFIPPSDEVFVRKRRAALTARDSEVPINTSAMEQDFIGISPIEVLKMSCKPIHTIAILLTTRTILLSLVAARHAPIESSRSGDPTFVKGLNPHMPKAEVGAMGAVVKGHCSYFDLISLFNSLRTILS